MDALLLPWTFLPGVVAGALMLAVAAQIVLVLRLLNEGGQARMKAGREGRITVDTYKVVGDEPPDLAIRTRAILNQSEIPVLFYAIVALHLAARTASWFTVILAVAFVALRWVHANEMLGENRVMVRRHRFIQGTTVLAIMLLEFVLAAVVVMLR